MDWLARLQVVVGAIWLVLGLGIVVWMVAPSQPLIDAIWWGFAVGCALTGVWMVVEPFVRRTRGTGT
jgi:hypothetical protein